MHKIKLQIFCFCLKKLPKAVWGHQEISQKIRPKTFLNITCPLTCRTSPPSTLSLDETLPYLKHFRLMLSIHFNVARS